MHPSNENSLKPNERIIFPLDLPTEEKALKYVKLLKDHVGVFKIGLELFTACGPSIVMAVKKHAPRTKIFLDLKLLDIPETVKRTTRVAASLGVDFLTVHSSEGTRILKAAVEGARHKVKLLGVTLLTSLDKQDIEEIGINKNLRTPLSLAFHRAHLAKLSGLDGVVCSPRETKAIKKVFDRDFLFITPGIRIKAVSKDDQKRIVTPYQAILNGADYLVIGRPIRDASNPISAADNIITEIEKAIKHTAG